MQAHYRTAVAHRLVVVQGARVASAQEQEEDRPDQPVRAEIDEAHADEEPQPRDEGRALAQQGIDDVAAVELADGQQVEAGQKQAEPTREAHRPEGQSHAFGGGAEKQPRQPLQEEGIAQQHAPVGVGVGNVVRAIEAEDQHRQGHDEAGQGSRDAHVEQRATMGERALDPDERAQRSDQAGERNEEGERRLDAVVEAGEVVAELVGEHDAQHPDDEPGAAHEQDRDAGHEEEGDVPSPGLPRRGAGRRRRNRHPVGRFRFEEGGKRRPQATGSGSGGPCRA